ncbi:hypothetical protein [Marinospirillum alkaliphilum]|uniref:Uncharacterized protein n=1 Tax=Marinospirillum alkaliphilum DSM 21637 TaxID=1122209 RepID=A0A1K1XYZ9_9GAMM|nr:hypothetical protein [Marinospirillum alkaliphilum]SFX54309.1 hypothetical protein SAMN02745752_02011 [Marinospirillum alkaliphilum DSM 21637]
MDRQYMTLGYYSGFDKLFKPTFEVLDYLKTPVWGDTKQVRELAREKIINDENDLEGLTRYLIEQNILHSTGQLIEGIKLDRALRERTHIELPLRDDEKRFGTAWTTIHKLDAAKGRLRRSVKLPIGTFEEGTPVMDILKALKPAFQQFDIDMALTDGVNKMLLVRRETLLEASTDNASPAA